MSGEGGHVFGESVAHLGKHNRIAVRESVVPIAQLGPYFFETPNVAVLFALSDELRARAQ